MTRRATVRCRVTIPACLSHTGKRRKAMKPIDAEVAPLVRALNAAGLTTIASCSGHGENGRIDLENGTVLVVKWPKSEPTP